MADVASLDQLPATPGAYALVIHLKQRLRAWPSKGPFLTPGLYLYAGSANGPGGIRARVQRHTRNGKTRHWHVDRLTCNAPVIAAAAVPGGQECAIVDRLSACTSVTNPAPGFGSSDCRSCTSHLLALPPEFTAHDLDRRVEGAIWWWRE